ncbi:AfsR/SARP family transcriptional regulator [Actinophytocola algeriensis]|uniref:DNA-binding SARP family transcriptional activator n=2 Tax=Actinophytocola algeriensis TaxID=1768010 RepID=A0A7W7Q7M5_9PSEU|nr:BTAD domain-containing putative transcriptional regulator [Actinophytocola algeriensis]MBB4908597.1 DNA-binding SARP family transcriptional activator [Actinophytocola algeriensis]MBE1475016.1 DNA-binding SARP family transcriptional activator [Actinophytocola algeriensis]
MFEPTLGLLMTPEHMHSTEDKPMITLRLLDGFELLLGDDQVPVIPSSQRILAYLALHEGSVPRQTVAATLWPRATAHRAAACLRSALWRLVKPPYPLVEGGRERLRIGTAVDVDVARIRRFVAERTLSAPFVPVATLAADLLPGWTDEWVVAEREWCRQMCLRALEMLSERFMARGDHFRAHETAAAAVRGDPLRESAHRRLIELHLADGNPAAVMRQYAAYQELLWTELGMAPSPEIRRLVATVLPE